MALSFLDWTIVLVMAILMIVTVLASRGQMKSVADFLAAGRSAGRYLIAISSGIAGLGAITIVGNLEMNLQAGFSMSWWGMTMGVVVLIVTVSGWVIYRFRQTRCLTLAQFFEVRYSRRFRIFTGMVAFFAGLINFGIFPAVGARFFIYFCGLPLEFSLLGMTISTFPLVMLILLSISLWFVFAGGQIAVIVSDFFQGVFVNFILITIVIYLFIQIDWDTIQQGLSLAPADASLINPFKTSQVKDFNFWYFLIGVFGFMYSTMSWQGTQGYNASAINAHEAKMGGVLGLWRGMPQSIMLTFVPIVAYTILNHPDFSSLSDTIQQQLQSVNSEAVQNQLKVPMVLQHLLPRGLTGAFVAVMFSAFISTHDTYLHSWGSIFIQDVIMPFRKKPFTKRQHLLALRLSILFVAVFIFLFSLFYHQTEAIFLFFAITGAIFAGGSGAVIIGGLYWKYGTASAAWAAMITGSTIAAGGIILHQVIPDFFINGQEFWAIGMGSSALVYVVISLAGGKKAYNMDKLLNRGDYTVQEEIIQTAEPPKKGWKLLGMGKEFSRGDKIIYIANYIWTFGWTIVFIIGTVYNLSHEVSNAAWMNFWRVYIMIHITLSVITIFWFTTGGILDLRKMFSRLEASQRNDSDDGFIREESTS